MCTAILGTQQSWAHVALFTIGSAVLSCFGHPVVSMPCISRDIKHPGYKDCWQQARCTGRMHAHVSAQSVTAALQLSGLHKFAVTLQAALVLMDDMIRIKGARSYVEGAGAAGQ